MEKLSFRDAVGGALFEDDVVDVVVLSVFTAAGAVAELPCKESV